jgi:hypothetical protein
MRCRVGKGISVTSVINELQRVSCKWGALLILSPKYYRGHIRKYPNKKAQISFVPKE